MNETNQTLNQLNNSYIQLLIKELNIETTFKDINVENIEDLDTKIICRTLLNSFECLTEHLTQHPT